MKRNFIMEKKKTSDKVWIFPTAGKRYHKRDCPYIAVLPTESVLTDDIERKYHSCSICDSKNLGIGNLIYSLRKQEKHIIPENVQLWRSMLLKLKKKQLLIKGIYPAAN